MTSRLLVLVFVASCGGKDTYNCTADSQCVRGGMDGTCAMGGFCAFPDPACEGGYRYEDNAGGGHAGQCTSSLVDSGVDAPSADTTCVLDVAFGRRFGCVVKMNGSVWCSGENNNGQLGFGLAGVKTATPMQVRDISTAVIADATALGAGRQHVCAIRANGTVWCWGANESGQLGNNATAQSAAAVQVLKASDNMPLTGIAEVEGGYNHTCARATNGGVFCWGANNLGQLGNGAATMAGVARAAPVLVAMGGAAFTGAVDLQVGGGHACVRKANDEMWCWGQGNDGAIGDGTNMPRPSPVQVGTAKNIATNLWATCRVNADTSISCHGWNRGGAFGIGVGTGYNDDPRHLTSVKSLDAVGGSPITGASKLAMGSGLCAIMTDGGVKCSGDGQYGQNGTGTSRVILATVKHLNGTPLTGVDRLVAKWPHVCAHKTAGGWECWGRNSEGEFGDGGFMNYGFATPLRASCP